MLAAFPSDRLPLQVLGVVVVCMLIYLAAGIRAGVASDPTAGAAGLSARLAPTAYGSTRDLEVCNRAAAGRLYVAVAYYDPQIGDWIARGWFPQDEGSCVTAMHNLNPPVYVYAESRDGRRRWDGGEGGREFCVDGERGFIQRQKDCLAAGESTSGWRRFRALETARRDIWEITP